MQSCEVVASITAIACALSQCYSDEELGFLSAAFSQLGDTLETIAAHRELCCGGDMDEVI